LIPKELTLAHQESLDGKGLFPVLFPLVDLANHSSTALVTWFSNAQNDPNDLSIINESDIPQHTQIFNNYAPKGNTELLLGYGFCLPGNDEVSPQIFCTEFKVMASIFSFISI
jgi:hypothetical protein